MDDFQSIESQIEFDADMIIEINRVVFARRPELPIPWGRLFMLFNHLKDKESQSISMRQLFECTTLLRLCDLQQHQMQKQLNFQEKVLVSQDDFILTIQFLTVNRIFKQDHFTCGHLFSLIDVNDDGVLSRHEYDSFFSKLLEMEPSLFSEVFKELFDIIDEDHSGEIDKKQWIHCFYKLKLYSRIDFPLEALSISRYEFQVIMENEFGINKNAAMSRFNYIDYNGDGTIDSGEIVAFKEETEKRITELSLLGHWETYVLATTLPYIIIIAIVLVDPRSISKVWYSMFEICLVIANMVVFGSLIVSRQGELKRNLDSMKALDGIFKASSSYNHHV